MSTLFLTGATGFVGSQVARLAAAAGWQVLALVMPGESLRRLEGFADRLTLLEGNLENLSALRPALQEGRPNVCMHLAWYVEPGKYLQAPQNLACLTAGLALLQELSLAGCRRVVGVGTCAEYDSRSGYFREDSPVRPETLYAACKLSLNLVGQQFAALNDMRFAWGRLFYLYGPGEDRSRIVPAAMHSLLAERPFTANAGNKVCDFLHVEDVAAGLWTLAEANAEGVFNVCSGEPVSIRTLLETIGEIMDRGALIRFGEPRPDVRDPPFLCGDNSRLRSLGWQPRYRLRAGLEQTLAWWREAARV